MSHRPPTRHDIGRMVEVSDFTDEAWCPAIYRGEAVINNSSLRFLADNELTGEVWWRYCRVPVASPDPQAELAIAADWLAQQGWDEAARVVIEAMEKLGS